MGTTNASPDGPGDGSVSIMACLLAAGVTVLALVLIGGMLFVVPNFEELFSDMEVELPAVTAQLLLVSWFLRHHPLVAVGVLVGISGLAWLVTSRGREAGGTWTLLALLVALLLALGFALLALFLPIYRLTDGVLTVTPGPT
jgi:hypothetical protein